MVKIPGNIRVRFDYHVQNLLHEGKVPLTIVRGGKEMKISLPVQARYPLVIPALNGAYPSYFIFGPLVFSNATMDFIGGYAKANAANGNIMTGFLSSPLVKRMMEKPTFPDEQLVVVSSPFFPHKLSEGYGNPMANVLKSVSGIPIKNLAHLVEVLRDSKDEFLSFEFSNQFCETLVFNRSEIVASTEGILSDNGIRSQGTRDTLAVWSAKQKN